MEQCYQSLNSQVQICVLMARTANTVTQFASDIPQEVKSVIRGLDDDIRLAIIIALMKNSSMSFADLKGLLNLNSSSLSHHLSILQNGGLVRNFVELTRNRNHRSYYMITELTKSILKSLFDNIVMPQEIPLETTENTLFPMPMMPSVLQMRTRGKETRLS
jgi:DNA-binding transcriptional ArsR family regulator